MLMDTAVFMVAVASQETRIKGSCVTASNVRLLIERGNSSVGIQLESHVALEQPLPTIDHRKRFNSCNMSILWNILGGIELTLQGGSPHVHNT